jgi:hypothetical protein
MLVADGDNTSMTWTPPRRGKILLAPSLTPTRDAAMNRKNEDVKRLLESLSSVPGPHRGSTPSARGGNRYKGIVDTFV